MTGGKVVKADIPKNAKATNYKVIEPKKSEGIFDAGFERAERMKCCTAMKE